MLVPVWIVFMFGCSCVCACMRVCLCVRAYHHNIQLRHSTNIVYNCLRSNTIENAVAVPLKTDSDEEIMRCIILCLAAAVCAFAVVFVSGQYNIFFSRQCIGCDQISEYNVLCICCVYLCMYVCMFEQQKNRKKAIWWNEKKETKRSAIRYKEKTAEKRERKTHEQYNILLNARDYSPTQYCHSPRPV